MKKFILAASLLIIANKIFSQTPGTREHARTLLELMGAGKVGVQVMNNVTATYKQSLPSVPQEFWDEFSKEINADTLVNLSVPAYMKHYSDEELVALIAFYKTPLGQKVVEKTPLITQETYQAGAEWGKRLSEKLMARLKEKGFWDGN